MTPAEAVTADWLMSTGYLISSGLKIGRKEVDLLAVKLSPEGAVEGRVHVEVSVSSTPFGGRSLNKEHCRAYIDEYYKDKFADTRVIEGIQGILRTSEYSRLLVLGIKPGGQAEIDLWTEYMLDVYKVQVIKFDHVVGELMSSMRTRPIGGEAQLFHILRAHGILRFESEANWCARLDFSGREKN